MKNVTILIFLVPSKFFDFFEFLNFFPTLNDNNIM